jgi:hypothetical protein
VKQKKGERRSSASSGGLTEQNLLTRGARAEKSDAIEKSAAGGLARCFSSTT